MKITVDITPPKDRIDKLYPDLVFLSCSNCSLECDNNCKGCSLERFSNCIPEGLEDCTLRHNLKILKIIPQDDEDAS